MGPAVWLICLKEVLHSCDECHAYKVGNTPSILQHLTTNDFDPCSQLDLTTTWPLRKVLCYQLGRNREAVRYQDHALLRLGSHQRALNTPSPARGCKPMRWFKLKLQLHPESVDPPNLPNTFSSFRSREVAGVPGSYRAVYESLRTTLSKTNVDPDVLAPWKGVFLYHTNRRGFQGPCGSSSRVY